MNKLARTIVDAISGSRDANGKVQGAVTEAIQRNKQALVIAASLIESETPDRKERNTRLSALRMQLRRACAVLKIAPYLSVKKVDGKWKLDEVQQRTPDELKTRRVQNALKVVEENIRDPEVLKALSTMLHVPPSTIKKGVRKVPHSAPSPAQEQPVAH